MFDTEAESLQRQLGDIQSIIAERDSIRAKGGNSADLVSRIRSGITKCDRLLERITEKITAKPEGVGQLSQKEVQRRRDIVRRSQTEISRLRALEKNVAVQQSASDRDSLLRAGGAGKPISENEPRKTSEQLMTMTKDETKVQDEILGNMSKGLDNLKNLGIAIRDETDLQVKLLDNLENEVDTGNRKLRTETGRAEHITRDTGTCWLYVTICLLLAILVGLLSYHFKPKR